MQTFIVVFGDVVRVPEIAGIQRASARCCEFTKEVGLSFPLAPSTEAAAFLNVVFVNPPAVEFQELAAMRFSNSTPTCPFVVIGFTFTTRMGKLNKASWVGHGPCPLR